MRGEDRDGEQRGIKAKEVGRDEKNKVVGEGGRRSVEER